MIVVDTNIITYLVLNGDYSQDCEKLFAWDSEILLRASNVARKPGHNT